MKGSSQRRQASLDLKREVLVLSRVFDPPKREFDSRERGFDPPEREGWCKERREVVLSWTPAS